LVVSFFFREPASFLYSAHQPSNIMGWGISQLGSKIDRREEAREAQRGVWIRYNRE
jgi:hypothetical protein